MKRDGSRNTFVKCFFAFACMTLIAASAQAKLENYYLSYVPDVLPGIDSTGNVDFGDTAAASIKITVNTKELRALAQARGKVNNFSRRSFKAEDSFAGLTLGPIEVVSDLYTVSAKGAASFVARVYFNAI